VTAAADLTLLGRALVEDYLVLVDDSAIAVLPHALRVFVDLGLPEALSAEPRSVDFLAWTVAAPSGSVRRLLTALATVDVVRPAGPDTFLLTDLGRRLLPSGDARSSVSNLDSALAWTHATEAIRDGGLAFSASQRRQSFFGHKDAAAGANQAFLTRMRERASRNYPALAASLDWSRARLVMDIGGGDGYLLDQVLRQADHLRGRLFDRAATLDVVAGADLGTVWRGRWETVPGDFFVSVPGGADLHLMASVLHDWTDAQALTLLRNSRAAIEPGGRLVIVEMVLPADGSPHPARWSDLSMMVLTGGRERTCAEYANLLAAAGYELTAVRQLPGSLFSVLEAG
jgi:hypothetical protein